MAFEAISEKSGPVEFNDAVECVDDVGARVGVDRVAAIIHAEKGTREIVQRLAAASQLTNFRIGVEPQQQTFVVVVLASLPTGVRQRQSRRDDRLIGGVDQRTPYPPRPLELIGRRHVGEVGAGQLGVPQPGTGGQHLAVVLGHAFIDPQQTVLHRCVEVGRCQVGATPVLAVPRVRHFMGQQLMTIGLLRLVPFREVTGASAVFAGAMMLQTDAAEVVRQRQQEIVVIVVLCAEQRLGLGHQVAVRGELLVRDLQAFLRVGHDIQVDRCLGARRKILATEVGAGEQRGIHQRIQRDRLEVDGPRAALFHLQCRAEIPAVRQHQTGVDRNTRSEIAGRIEHHGIPLQADDVRSGDDPPLRLGQRRGELEFERYALYALGHGQVERINVQRVTCPFDALFAGPDDQSGQRRDRAARCVIPRQPFGVVERQRAGFDGDCFLHAKHAMGTVRCIHAQLDRAGIGRIQRCTRCARRPAVVLRMARLRHEQHQQYGA